MKSAHWRDDTRRSRYPPCSSAVRQSVGDGFQAQASKAFGDFFLRGHLEEPLPNHARDFSVSEGFQVESEVLFLRKIEKAAFRKLDRKILPLLSLFTFCLYLDPRNMLDLRTLNFTGLQISLKLTDEQYLLGMTAKYIACIATALPWNLVLGRLGGGTQLPLLLMVWGGITLSHAFLDRGFGGLLAARIFLGIVEGGIFPGLILYLATFYTRLVQALQSDENEGR
ncbi:hypothetical protein DFH28DRAFT_882890 [Melampsora americana]|nr:hypothetical protein DFH28DRAFT_882890 [Melampsora americana]